jgi:AcrR family transcriptional regulator
MEPHRLREITAAAEELFSRQGYHATTVRQMAGALDLQGGSLYAHIRRKEDVLTAIVDGAAREFEAATDEVVAAGGSPADRLRAAIRAHVRVVAGNLPAATVYFQDWRHLSEPRLSEVRRRRDRYEATWRAIIAEGVATGDFRAVDPWLGAVACLSVCNWIYQWYRPDGALDPDSLAASLADVLLGGLRAGTEPEGEAT